MASHFNFAFQKAGWPGWHEANGREIGLSYSGARTARCLRASLAELDALFATLQHRAFRGEL